MLRQMLLKKTNTESEKFLVRGKEVLRIESFSDGVFAFTVTLLVVSLEVPQTFTELLNTMHDFLAFAIGFSILIGIWYWQYQFFRRFGLNDSVTIFLNAALLFMVLFYAFPLKFLWKLLFDQLLGYDINVRLPDNTVVPRVEDAEAPWIMVIYGLGFLSVNFVLALMYWHAYRKGEELELSPLEKFDTVSILQTYLISGLVAIISILVVVVGGNSAISLSGFSYFLLPIFIPIYSNWRRGQRRKLEKVAKDADSAFKKWDAANKSNELQTKQLISPDLLLKPPPSTNLEGVPLQELTEDYLAKMNPERRLEVLAKLPAEERLNGLPTEEIIRVVPVAERTKELTAEQKRQLLKQLQQELGEAK